MRDVVDVCEEKTKERKGDELSPLNERRRWWWQGNRAHRPVEDLQGKAEVIRVFLSPFLGRLSQQNSKRNGEVSVEVEIFELTSPSLPFPSPLSSRADSRYILLGFVHAHVETLGIPDVAWER